MTTPGDRSVQLRFMLRVLSEIQSEPDINITEVFYPTDIRARTPKYNSAIKIKVDGVFSRA